MNLRFFIDRPVFSGVISVVIVLMGAIAIFSLPVEQYPDIAPPIINVWASYSPVGGSYQRRGGYDLYDLYRLEYR